METKRNELTIVKSLILLTLLMLLSVSSALARESLDVIFSTEQPIFTQGSTVQIMAKIYYQDGTPVSTLKESSIILKDSRGETVTETSMQKVQDGLFSLTYSLSDRASIGAWGVRAHFSAHDRRYKGEWEGERNRLFQVAQAPNDDDDDYTDPPVDPNNVDNDSDGYTENQGDCNDSSASINPGAEEICGDGIDQDCSGADLICPIDPNDVDNDSDGYTENQGDCNDSSASINPGAEEICGDGIDQDCNGTDLICPIDPNDVDNDSDGYTENQGDCNDSSASVNPGAEEICGDGIDQDCNGTDLICPIDPNDVDNDSDGYTENQGDCNDSSASINPGAEEICGDGIDQDCNGTDLICPIDPNDVDNDNDGYSVNQGDCNDSDVAIHPAAVEITGNGIDENCNGMSDDTATYSDNHYNNADCLLCHTDDATEVHGSVHYQWQGSAPYMTNGAGLQGKFTNGVNSYCINIMGNWAGCSSCHVGKGAMPEPVATQAQLENIDCLKCHSEPGILPTRTDCLACHAKAGGGDAVKRGDLALATGNTTDRNYDVHMATSGGNLECRSCHTTQNHRIAGKGSDLRPTDLDVSVECSNCHSSTPHTSRTTNRHTARVACQTCHIPIYAKDAVDTVATEATETHRTWRATHATAAPFHPAAEMVNNLTPKYRFWNGTSNSYLLGDVAQMDPTTGAYPTSRPEGGINETGSKLYPFKYKTAEQPMASGSKQLIALDTSIFFSGADADAATRQGLVNMGMSDATGYEWVMTDTYQLLNHQVSPKDQALLCSNCHNNTSRMDLEGELGYNLKDSKSSVCQQCHGDESYSGYQWIHDKHVTDKRYDCSWCHNFSRPERGLRMP